MSTEENRMLVHRFFEELWNQGNLAVTDVLLASGHVHHFFDGDITGPEGVKQLVTWLRTAFPDIHTSTDDVVAEADKFLSDWITQSATEPHLRRDIHSAGS
jgi:hypothetical protein